MYGGLTIEKQFSPKSYFQTGFLVSYTDTITFLEIPLFYKYILFYKLSIITGPKIDYIPDKQNNQFVYFKQRFGLSLNLGLDYEIFKNFVVEGYYSKGFVKQYDDLMLTFYDSKRNVYRVGVTYFFN